jgi:hypothetical protein
LLGVNILAYELTKVLLVAVGNKLEHLVPTKVFLLRAIENHGLIGNNFINEANRSIFFIDLKVARKVAVALDKVGNGRFRSAKPGNKVATINSGRFVVTDTKETI